MQKITLTPWGNNTMRPTKRLIALGLASALLAACGHKDKDAPLAFVPADTPYVFANLETLDDDTRTALIGQANERLPGQLNQMKTLADELDDKGNTDAAHLLRAFVAELDGKNIETFAKNAGLDIKGHSAVYGVGLSPVARLELTDPVAFEGFVARLETAYGQKLEIATIGAQSYRHVTPKDSGVQVVLAVVGKQAVATLLPADAAQPLVREALGLDRPEKNIQDDGRLDKLAKAKGYKPYAVGLVDLVRMLPLIATGKDPLFTALIRHKMLADAAQTGEPVATLPLPPASCQADASRIAARIPAMSFGYTRLDATHQEQRFDIALAPDITSAFSGLKVETPGLGQDGDAPFDASIALPIEQLRTFWSAQADAVAAKPFGCPALADLNDGFAKIGPAMQQAAIPPIGDLRGLRLSLDSLVMPAAGAASQMPSITGRVLIATRNPTGLLAMAQAFMPAIASVKLTNDGKPVALPSSMTAMVGQPGWAAMNPQALAIGLGAGQDAKLGDMLKASTGDSGRMARMHLSGDMYRTWISIMADKANSFAETAPPDPTATGADAAAKAEKIRARAAQQSKAQFDAMREQAARVLSAAGEAHVDSDGLVITGKNELK
jgi:hypothetical protein